MNKQEIEKDEILVKLDPQYHQCIQCHLFYSPKKTSKYADHYNIISLKEMFCAICGFYPTLDYHLNRLEKKASVLQKELQIIKETYAPLYTIVRYKQKVRMVRL